jgi:5-deoxy-glucuronate isomerase
LCWQTFGTLTLFEKGDSYEGQLEKEEAILTLLFGQAEVEIHEESGLEVRYSMGPRKDPFVERTTMVYLPPRAKFQIVAISPVFKSTLHKVPVKNEGHALLIQPGQVTPVSTGTGNWRRDVSLCTAMDLPIQRLVMGETINPPGNWSSYPPHKHDEEFPPEEAVFEEVYHFLLKPEQGFGFIRLYDPPRRKDRMDEVFVIQNGDTVVIPHGYHPVTVAPGYQIFYLFSLAGEKRQYGAWRDDPNHHWVRSLAQ